MARSAILQLSTCEDCGCIARQGQRSETNQWAWNLYAVCKSHKCTSCARLVYVSVWTPWLGNTHKERNQSLGLVFFDGFTECFTSKTEVIVGFQLAHVHFRQQSRAVDRGVGLKDQDYVVHACLHPPPPPHTPFLCLFSSVTTVIKMITVRIAFVPFVQLILLILRILTKFVFFLFFFNTKQMTAKKKPKKTKALLNKNLNCKFSFESICHYTWLCVCVRVLPDITVWVDWP